MSLCIQCGREIGNNVYCGGCGAPASGSLAGSSPYRAPQAQTDRFTPALPEQSGPPRTSTKAIVGFVFSLIPCVLGAIPGLVLSLMARGEVRRSNGALTGGGLALAGIILSSVWLTFGTVGVLAAIAIPNYIKFQARSKQVEAKANLRTLGAEIRAYKQEHSGSLPTTFADLGAAPQSTRYTYYLGRTDSVSPKLGESHQPPAGLDYRNAVVVAVGNVDADNYLDVWTVDEAGALHQLQDDINDTQPHGI